MTSNKVNTWFASIPNLLIKTTNNNDFYVLIQFNSYRREADEQNKSVLTTERTTTHHTILQLSVWSITFNWPIPLPLYSKIVSLEIRMRHTTRKWQHFQNRKCKMSNTWWKIFLLPMEQSWPSTKILISGFLISARFDFFTVYNFYWSIPETGNKWA